MHATNCYPERSKCRQGTYMGESNAERSCLPPWLWLALDWDHRQLEWCHACDARGHIENGEDCNYCGGRGVYPRSYAPPRPEPAAECGPGAACA